ncbi:MAG: hypothetical protein B6U86_00225 [Candidatus Altiarchaeales archaeon ex4484_43]|nr:MAG: hypothetical protein B6U86_00225 [Candidatus Altiarchaeales archaeon ex4484_43]
MVKRRKRNPEKIKRDILEFIEKLDFPTTTEGIAKGVGLNWFTASFYLSELRAEGKIFHKRVGRQNQWWTENIDEQRKRMKKLEGELMIKDGEIKKLRRKIRELKGKNRVI